MEPIKVCAGYKPKLARGAKGGGLTLAQLSQADAWPVDARLRGSLKHLKRSTDELMALTRGED